MTEKIFRSIITVAITVLIASIVIATSFLYEYFSNSQVNRLKSEISLVADMVNAEGITYFEKLDSNAYRFTLVDDDGTVLYDTQANPSEMENHSDREEIAEALNYGKGSSARTSATLTEKTIYETILLNSGDVLRMSVSQLSVGGLLIGMFPAICAIILFAVVVAFILSHSMAKKITAPLMNIDLENPCENNAYEELNPILTKIRMQHKQISTQMETLRQKSHEFEQIISSMNEGLVLLDEHSMVLSMNTAAKKIFNVKEESNYKDFLLIDRTSKMNKAVWDAIDGKHSEYTEERDGNEYQFNINPIKSDKKNLGVIILAFDITDKAFAERNRKEFTANVSHELKTPLQSIIGSAELLENGLVKPEDTGRFVGNIRKEATRLVSLIDDIIRLSQLDENQESIRESVDIKEVAKEVVEILSVSAEKKNVTIDIEGEPQTINGVRRYIYEIVYNLCDNAIRYNKDGGKVNISIKGSGNNTSITVSDTGIGIAPEHRSRVFERFYRVDKSHSKETGGTGLGLAIVKHGAAYHNAEISLESEEGKGTSITVTFKPQGT